MLRQLPFCAHDAALYDSGVETHQIPGANKLCIACPSDWGFEWRLPMFHDNTLRFKQNVSFNLTWYTLVPDFYLLQSLHSNLSFTGNSTKAKQVN